MAQRTSILTVRTRQGWVGQVVTKDDPADIFVECEADPDIESWSMVTLNDHVLKSDV